MAVLASGALAGALPAQAGASPGKNLLYVANYSNANTPSITSYRRHGDGNVAPVATVAGPATGLNQPSSPGLDSSGDVWVANFGANSLTEYAPDASGNAAPITTIQGPHTGLNAPDNATIDSRGHIWVANYSTDGVFSVTEYGSDASGNTKPIRTIEGPDTQLLYPSDVVLDAAGHIFVSNDMSIVEYAPDASGNAKPIASIHGPHTGLNGAAGLTIGPDGQVYVANFGYYPGYVWPGPSYGSVTVYRRGANGDASPIREIKGDYPSNDRTGLSGGPCGEPALDSQGNVYVATVTSNTVRVFGPDATGNVAPIRTIAGPSTGISSPVGVFLG